MDIEVRKLDGARISEISSVVQRAAKSSLADVPPNEAEQILSRWSPENLKERVKGGTCWMAEDEGGKILGVIGLKEENRVTLFYVDPEYQRKGVGERLYRELEKMAIERGCEKLVTRSSPVAVPVYEKLGFKKVKTEWTTHEGGRKSYNVWMENTLR